MSNSSLVTVKIPANANNYSVGRSGRKIEKIGIHHMAGILTAKQCGNIFQNANRGASSNYGIGKDADVGLYVDEENTSWCNSNWDSNCKSVTIETSNCEIGGDWKVSDKVLNKLIELVADIAKRNKLGKLVKGKNVVWHSMYAATSCPGKYLLNKMDYIVEQANKINGQTDSSEKEDTTVLEWQKMMNKVYNCGLAEDNSFGPDCREKALKYYLYYKIPTIKNEHVKFIQNRLCKHGYKVAVDGSFGPDSEAKTKQFQKAKGITVDGYVGADTTELLLK